MYRRGTPGKSDGFSFWITFSVGSSWNCGISTSFAASEIPRFIATVIPYEWKNGMMHMIPSVPSVRPGNHEAPCFTFATRLRWVSIAPLESPVVPPV